ncbi:MAG: DUF418 domain-containing protein [Gammaproteobacteria bacterium]|nr:DUF418 domain-containing protein [Gammaproteobacteria bacterium]MBT6582846.1 DUF418 domain-containing protein [Gammaproteobacteria bacterium]MBT7879099.1 DUF418 domain-containing protein [Gammaproteobacteria bacterium]
MKTSGPLRLVISATLKQSYANYEQEAERLGKALLTISPCWSARFYVGPVEWLWRAMTCGAVPMLRRSN